MSSNGLKHLLFTIAAFAALLIANVTVGAKSHSPAAAAPAEAQAPASADYQAAMRQVVTKMEQDLRAAPVSGSADCDFVATMIPHHQGAIDMAKAYLKHAKDPEQIKLANQIIAENEAELAELRARFVKSRAIGEEVESK